MNYQQTEAYLSSKPGAEREFPFGPDVAVFKIMGKMFATLGIEKGLANMNLKCVPEEALALRDIYDAIIPGYHMNKKHWNTVILNNSIPASQIELMIDQSYDLVVNKLTKHQRLSLLKYSAPDTRT